MQNSSAFQYLAIDTIHESTTNPRRTFDQNKLRELAESIKHHGLLNTPADFLHTMMTASGTVAKRTAPLAGNFLDFISNPLP